MERHNQHMYHHSGLGEENRRNQEHGGKYNNDFGRGYDRRSDNQNGRSIEERRKDLSRFDNHAELRAGNHDFDNQEFREYRQHDRELKDAYAGNVRGERQQLSNIRQGYGFSDFRDDHDAGRQQQQGYNSGRMGGYSGSAFGGSNYSSHGGFGGAPTYGAMSGDNGNVNRYTSSSGYGGGENSYRRYPDNPMTRENNSFTQQRHNNQFGNSSADRFNKYDTRHTSGNFNRQNEQNW